MIERFIENELTLKRWRRFKSRRTAVFSAFCLLFMTFLTVTAELISNNRPIVMRYQGELYFPAYRNYHAEAFGITDYLVPDYKEFEFTEPGDFAIWPIIRWDPNESNIDVDYYPAPPSSVNLLGTDNRGRDVLSRLLYGFRYSMAFAVFVWLITFITGTILGGIMGYAGGRIDFFGQRVVEVLSTVPQFFLLIILISIFQPNLTLLILVSSIFAWIPISYYVRGEFLKNRKKEFVEAALSMGASHASVIFKHILPNSLTSVITFAPFTISMNIIILASLDFLGFGLPVYIPSWGEMLNQAQTYATTSWWLAVFPSLALFITLTFLNLFGEGVRDALDPNFN